MVNAVINVLLTVDTCESSRADAAGKRLGGGGVLMVLESKAKQPPFRRKGEQQ